MTWNHDARPAGHAVVTTGKYLNCFYPGEPLTFTLTGVGGAVAATIWEVRDYYGELVASGTVTGATISLPPTGLGYYTLYLHRPTPAADPWGIAGGVCRFCVVRTGMTDRLSGLLAPEAFTRAGPRRLTAILGSRYESETTWNLARLDEELAAWGNDPVRPLNEFVHFADGTGTDYQIGVAPTPTDVAQITDTVTRYRAKGVDRFEGWNEPNNFSSPAAEHGQRTQVFASHVHAAGGLVLGPCTISIAQHHLNWTRDTLVAAGPAAVDIVSFHNYNGSQGDLMMGRRVMDRFVGMLTDIGFGDKPRMNSEACSYFASVYGVHEPRLQVQWSMLDLFLYEQYGIPKEDCHIFYSLGRGFWDYPSWWIHREEDETHPTPMVAILRVYSQELVGKTFDGPLDFGTVENDHWIGNRFTSPTTGESVLAIMSAGRAGHITLAVFGSQSSVEVVDAFGAITSVPVVKGLVTVEVGAEPCYVRLLVGMTATPEVVDYGVNLIGATSIVSSSDESNGRLRQVADGILDNDVDGLGLQPFSTTQGAPFPVTITRTWSEPRRFDTVELVCPPAWQHDSVPLDFDVVVVAEDGSRRIVGSYVAAPATWVHATHKAAGGCFVESCWDRRRIWVFTFDPVSAVAVELVVRDASRGGHAADIALAAGGQGTPRAVTIQDLRVYLRSRHGDGLPVGYSGRFLHT